MGQIWTNIPNEWTTATTHWQMPLKKRVQIWDNASFVGTFSKTEPPTFPQKAINIFKPLSWEFIFFVAKKKHGSKIIKEAMHPPVWRPVQSNAVIWGNYIYIYIYQPKSIFQLPFLNRNFLLRSDFDFFGSFFAPKKLPDTLTCHEGGNIIYNRKPNLVRFPMDFWEVEQ